MRISRSTIALLALAVAAAPSYAQKDPKKPAPAPAKEAPAKAEPASLVIHVTGLTKDNQTSAEKVLSALGSQEYQCPKCKHTQADAGQCSTCKVDLKKEERHALSGVRANLEAESLAFTPSMKAAAKLSEIESALATSSVKVDEARLTLPGSSTLVVTGGAEADSAAIEKALTAPGLFQEAHARYDAKLNALAVQVRAGTTAPERSAAAKAIESAKAKAHLTDIVWGAPAART